METSAEDAAIQSSMDKREWPVSEVFALFLFIVLTFAYRAFFIRYYDVVSADGTSYSLCGKAFFETWDPSVFGTIAPPLYSIFIGLCNLIIDDLELSSRLVSVLFSTLTIIPIYLLGKEAFGRIAAVIAVLFFATLPFIHGMSGFDITEPTYTFFVTLGGYYCWKAFLHGKLSRFLIAGILLGAAYLARPEAFIVCFSITIFFIGKKIIFRNGPEWKRVFLSLGIFWCGFMILAAPYIVFLYDETGIWQLSGKSGVNSEVIREYNGFSSVSDQKFRLDNHGNLTVGKGESLFKLMIDEPQLFWGNILGNVKALPTAFREVFPIYFWPIVVIGFVAYPWRGDPLSMRLILLSLLAPISIYTVFFVQPRGFYAYLPVLFVWIGAGCSKVEGWLNDFGRLRYVPLLLLIPVLVLCGYYIYIELPRPKPPYHYMQDGGRFDDKQVGLRLRTIIPGETPIMTRSGRIAYYAKRAMVIPPQASFEEIISYGRKNKAEYLIATVGLLSMRPQLEFLYGPLRKDNNKSIPILGLQLVYVGQEPGGLPYLVYRIQGE